MTNNHRVAVSDKSKAK